MDILAVLMLFAPLVLILWLANEADRKREHGEAGLARSLTWIAFGLLLCIYGLLGSFGLIFVVMGLLQRGPLGAQLADFYASSGLGDISWIGAGLGLLLPALLGVILLLPPVRRLIARLVPIDAETLAHARFERCAAHRLAGFGATHPQHMAAGRRGTEIVVEGDDAMHFGTGEVEHLGNQRLGPLVLRPGAEAGGVTRWRSGPWGRRRGWLPGR